MPRRPLPFAPRGAPVAVLALVLLNAAGCSAGDSALPPPSQLGNADRGRLLLAQYQCGSCHAIPGVASAGGKVGPSLAGFGRRSYIAGRLANRPELLVAWIAQPQALLPGTAMPSMSAPPADARDMAAYLLELR